MDFIQAINLILEGPSSVRYSFIQAINLILERPSSVRYSFRQAINLILEGPALSGIVLDKLLILS